MVRDDVYHYHCTAAVAAPDWVCAKQGFCIVIVTETLPWHLYLLSAVFKSYEPAKIYMSPPPFPPPLPPKSMHQVIDIPEMSGISLFLFFFSFYLSFSFFFYLSFFFFSFFFSFFFLEGQGGWGLGKGFPSYSCCNADSVLQYYLPTPVPTQGKWVGERIMYSC